MADGLASICMSNLSSSRLFQNIVLLHSFQELEHSAAELLFLQQTDPPIAMKYYYALVAFIGLAAASPIL